MPQPLKIGDSFDVYEFTYEHESYALPTGFQSVGYKNGRGYSITGTDGLTYTCWSDELKLIGSLRITKLKKNG